jgi:hypothetical protein
MRAIASTLISAALMIAPWSASLSPAAELQTRDETTSITPGEYGYVPAGATGAALTVRSPDALPPATAGAQKTLQGLSQSKLPSNRPADVVKASASVKAGSAD